MIDGNSINLAKKNTATKKMSEEKTHVSLSLSSHVLMISLFACADMTVFTCADDVSLHMCN
jgi:hypothetical protein